MFTLRQSSLLLPAIVASRKPTMTYQVAQEVFLSDSTQDCKPEGSGSRHDKQIPTQSVEESEPKRKRKEPDHERYCSVGRV